MNIQDLHAYLDRGLTLEDLNNLEDDALEKLEALLEHWHQLAARRIEGRRAATLQDLEDAGWQPEHLETRNGFDRYSLDGLSLWACPDCGSIDADPIEGCEACGYATAEEPEYALCV